MCRKKREYSYGDWKKAMELHNKYKLGYRRISKILGISEGTVNNWLYKGIVPPSAKWKAEPCIELAYVIGTVHGDASVCKNKRRHQYIIELNTIDSEFVEIFSRMISRLLGVRHHEPYWNEKEKKWQVAYRSKAFFIWYKKTKKQGLEGFKPYIEHDIETVRHYLKGLFDSEGSNNRNKQIRLTNSKKKLLGYVQYLLEKCFDIKSTGPYLVEKAGSIMMINGRRVVRKHDCYEISINRKEDIQRFLEEIGFTIVRKQLGLRKHEKVFVEGIGHVQPFKLVELGLFKLPFNQ